MLIRTNGWVIYLGDYLDINIVWGASGPFLLIGINNKGVVWTGEWPTFIGDYDAFLDRMYYGLRKMKWEAKLHEC